MSVSLNKVILLAATMMAGCVTSNPEVPVPPVVNAAPAVVAPPKYDTVLNARSLAACQPKAQRQGGGLGLPMTPSDLATMTGCRPQLPTLTSASGSVDAQGDCALTNGVICHFHHGGNEFGAKGLAGGEVHCIFPTSKADHPTVVGFMYNCRAGTNLAKPASDSDKACGSKLFELLGSCGAERRCCAYGNLTDEWSKQSAAQRAVRPNFAICAVPKTIDCGASGPLAGMVAHSSNDGLQVR